MYCQHCGKKAEGSSELCPECIERAEVEREKQQAHDEWRAQMAQKLNQKSADGRSCAPTASKMPNLFCTNCGAKIDSNAAFCPSCGKQLGEENTSSIEEKKLP